MYVTRKDVKEGEEGIHKEENNTVTLVLRKKVNSFLNIYVCVITTNAKLTTSSSPESE
jgi:hypothetical protein